MSDLWSAVSSLFGGQEEPTRDTVAKNFEPNLPPIALEERSTRRTGCGVPCVGCRGESYCGVPSVKEWCDDDEQYQEEELQFVAQVPCLANTMQLREMQKYLEQQEICRTVEQLPSQRGVLDSWRDLFPQPSMRRRNTSNHFQLLGTTKTIEESRGSPRDDDADVLAETRETTVDAPMVTASAKQIADGKWRIHGIHRENMIKRGLRRLDRRVDPSAIKELPCNATGKCILFRETMMKALLDGTRRLKEVPQNDVVAAQKDLSLLSLSQLIRLRVLNLDFVPSGSSVHSTFLLMIEGLIYQNLGQRVLDSTDCADLEAMRRFGRDLLMLIAAAKSIPMYPCWVIWFEEDRIFLHVEKLSCTKSTAAAFTEVGSVLEFVDKSEPDRRAPGKTWMELIVTLVCSEALLTSQPSLSNAGNSFTAASSFTMSANELKDARSMLKPVQRRG